MLNEEVLRMMKNFILWAHYLLENPKSKTL